MTTATKGETLDRVVLPANPSEQEYFGVRVAGLVRLALPLTDVQSVLRIGSQEICPIPGIPAHVLGVINQRGALVWVLDLSQFLELAQRPTPSGSSFLAVVLQMRGQAASEEHHHLYRVACLVSELEGIHRLDEQRFDPLPQELRPAWREIFRGLSLQTLSPASPKGSKKTAPPSALPPKVRVAVLHPPALFRTLGLRDPLPANLHSLS
ncbi:MAG: chemotaxis protein CheW [Cyanobacteriota bacterium]|nr:chemotaxis protein CheW [Cyanobacteriota bacterium]